MKLTVPQYRLLVSLHSKPRRVRKVGKVGRKLIELGLAHHAQDGTFQLTMTGRERI